MVFQQLLFGIIIILVLHKLQLKEQIFAEMVCFSNSLNLNINPLPANAGIILGTSTVCQGQNSVTYTVPLIANATSYIWTLPTGATGTSTINTITVNYGITAVSGNITVKGINSCGNGAISILAVTVNPVYTFMENHSICNGETYNWHGTNYNTAGTFTANYTSINGCNSIYTLHLIFLSCIYLLRKP